MKKNGHDLGRNNTPFSGFCFAYVHVECSRKFRSKQNKNKIAMRVLHIEVKIFTNSKIKIGKNYLY